MIITGSVISVLEDLSFDLIGYVSVLVYDIIDDALEGLLMKKKFEDQLDDCDKTPLGPVGVLFYSAFFNLIPVLAIAVITQDPDKLFASYPGWTDPALVLLLVAALVCGLLFVYFLLFNLCISINSPVMAQVVLSLKNVLVTYIGMFVGGDYVFTTSSFIGLNISIIGGLIYCLLSFLSTNKTRNER